MRKTISQSKLLKYLELSRASIAIWKKQGCPYRKEKNTSVFEIEKLREWMRLNGKDEYMAKFNSYFPSAVENEKDKVQQIMLSEIDGGDECGTITDIFSARDETVRILNQLNTEYRKAPADMKIYYIKNIREMTEQLRKVTESCIEIDEKLKRVMLVSDVQKAMARICGNIRNKFLNLPGAVCDQLASVDNSGRIEEILRKRVYAILKELSETKRFGTV
jgi:hypothetical protein